MERIAPDELDDNGLELWELMAVRFEVVKGRLTGIFDEGRYVDGYREQRIPPSRAAAVGGFYCACLIDTTAAMGVCTVCHRPKRPRCN